MDTICEKKPADTTVTLFGKEFSYPFFAGPVGAVKLHYGEKYTDPNIMKFYWRMYGRRNCGIYR